MNKDQRKFLLIVLLICFGFAGDRIARFYYQHIPVAKEGQCLKVRLPDHSDWTKAEVISNDFEEGYCSLKLDIDSPINFADVEYQTLRDSDAQRISCDEKVN